MDEGRIVTRRKIKDKPEGTLLAGRYDVKRVVGKGGFSIVYEAVDTQNGSRVAVKECTEPSGTERFLREAGMLRDFAEESAIVSVLDTFEENDTAYIVMEYVDGVTLREHIKGSGKMKAEDAVKLFYPVMDALAKLHAAGIIHRDISPDNLMLRPDKSLVLLDFGAARSYHEPGVSRLVFKSSYSPPEQMDDKGVLGSYTDIYSLCATMYYCLTGHDPDDVLARLLLDELRAPSELGSDIKPQAEKLLMNGLALDAKTRLQSAAQLKAGLEEVYPLLTEEELAAIIRKKKRKRNRIAGTAAAVILVAAIAWYIVRVPVILHFSDTTVMMLNGSDMTEEEFKQSSEIVKERVSALTDGIYEWDQYDQIIQIETLSDCYDKTKWPLFFMQSAVAQPMELYFGVRYDDYNEDLAISDMWGGYQYVRKLQQETDIDKVSKTEDGIEVTFTDEAAAQLDKYVDLDTPGDHNIRLAFDIRINPFAYYEAQPVGDGKSIVITSGNEHDFRALDVMGVPYKLTELQLTGSVSEKAFGVSPATYFFEEDLDLIDWDDPSKSKQAGFNQVKADKVTEGSGSDAFYKSFYTDDKSSDVTDAMDKISRRLDALGIPYAIGIDSKDSRVIWIKVPADAVCEEEMYLLGCVASKFTLGSAYGEPTEHISLPDPLIENKADGYFTLSCNIGRTGQDQQTIKYYLNNLKQRGQSSVYLYIEHKPIASVSIDEALADIADNGQLEFDTWLMPDHPSMDSETIYMANFFTSITMNPLSGYYDYHSFDFRLDSEGNVAHTELPVRFAGITENKIVEWSEQYNHELGFNYVITDKRLIITYSYEDEGITKADDRPLALFHQFYEDNQALLSSGAITTLSFEVYSSNLSSIQTEEETVASRKLLERVDFDMNEEAGGFICYDSPESATRKYFGRDSIFKDFFAE